MFGVLGLYNFDLGSNSCFLVKDSFYNKSKTFFTSNKSISDKNLIDFTPTPLEKILLEPCRHQYLIDFTPTSLDKITL